MFAVRPAAAADSDGPVSSRRPLPPTPQLTAVTTSLLLFTLTLSLSVCLLDRSKCTRDFDVI